VVNRLNLCFASEAISGAGSEESPSLIPERGSESTLVTTVAGVSMLLIDDADASSRVL
jgi:hypothetical protein